MEFDWKYALVALAKVVVLYHLVIVMAALMTLAERKVSAWMQYRIGPNRVGPFGILQPLADGVKFIFKEEVLPAGAMPLLFRLAPAIAALPAMLTLAVIPFGGEIKELKSFLGGRSTYLSITDLDIGLLYMLSIGGLGVYGIILGGWVSNSKFSLMGGLRASAQMISYDATPPTRRTATSGSPCASRWPCSSSWWRSSPRRTATPSTSPSASPSWWAASTPSTAR